MALLEGSYMELHVSLERIRPAEPLTGFGIQFLGFRASRSFHGRLSVLQT